MSAYSTSNKRLSEVLLESFDCTGSLLDGIFVLGNQILTIQRNGQHVHQKRANQIEIAENSTKSECFSIYGRERMSWSAAGNARSKQIWRKRSVQGKSMVGRKCNGGNPHPAWRRQSNMLHKLMQFVKQCWFAFICHAISCNDNVRAKLTIVTNVFGDWLRICNIYIYILYY